MLQHRHYIAEISLNMKLNHQQPTNLFTIHEGLKLVQRRITLIYCLLLSNYFPLFRKLIMYEKQFKCTGNHIDYYH